MSRLIDADALIEKYIVVIRKDADEKLKTEIAVLLKDIEEQPTVDAEPVRHGKWRWVSSTYDRTPMEREYECSECHHKTILHGDGLPWEKYCPNCGARMDEE